ncbi:MAG: helix-turn-helix transcriptional regulator [Clostridia bacterium]|nr:helix-turn-helix transcriptional regulator [Clostridia bacterium]
MMISENIAKYRKQRGLTQEQLGELVGVSNQSVSKWESAVSLPDVMLLPDIARALGITLDELYGIAENGKGGDLNARCNKFAVEMQKTIRNRLFYELFENTQSLRYMVRFERDGEMNAHINSGYSIGAISYTGNGAAFISEDLSVVASALDIKNGGRVFESPETAAALRKLCSADVRKVFAYLYEKAFEGMPDDFGSLENFMSEHDLFDHPFTVREVSEGCKTDAEAVYEAVDALVSLRIAEEVYEGGRVSYIFMKTRAVEAAAVFEALAAFARGGMQFGCGYVVGHGTLSSH